MGICLPHNFELIGAGGLVLTVTCLPWHYFGMICTVFEKNNFNNKKSWTHASSLTHFASSRLKANSQTFDGPKLLTTVSVKYLTSLPFILLCSITPLPAPGNPVPAPAPALPSLPPGRHPRPPQERQECHGQGQQGFRLLRPELRQARV